MAAKRPITTHYNGGNVGRATTGHAALIAASRRLLSGDYHTATVCDERGKVIADLFKQRKKLDVFIHQPRKVK